MTSRRVFLPPAALHGDHAVLTPEARHHLVDVLRLLPGEAIEVFDGQGGAWDGTLAPGLDVLALGPRREAARPGADVRLLVALAKGEKMDLVVQKTTELGVTAVVPFEAERSVVRLEGERAEERARRWRRIAEEAARQCGRADVPDVLAPRSLAKALAAIPAGFALHVFHVEAGEAAGSKPPAAAAPGHALVVGPEGGLTAGEVAACLAAGARPATLGPRVLRAETAAIVAVALAQARHGDLAGAFLDQPPR
ncbi:MAG: 16S rRNA (uracil(1498)-N(3))-methyltransferase [Anaeromyxobacteraceae bacterium]